jgi:GNAT superfamily N-acetyltransferase
VSSHIPGLSAPQLLSPLHDLDEFQSGVGPLDDWLKRHGRHNEAEGGSRTLVVSIGRQVVGYYSLATGSLLPAAATGRVKRNLPNSIPVVLLGRLAIHRRVQGRGLGGDLLRDAVRRSLAAGDAIGVRAILVHAVSPEAKDFYERHGFEKSPVDPMMLMVTLAEAERASTGCD